MKYGDKKHMIFRCIAKPHKLKKVFVAHLPWMKPIGNDYAALLEIDIHNKGLNIMDSNRISEVIELTDAEFDVDKLKALLIRRDSITEKEFDDYSEELKDEMYIKNIKEKKFELNDKTKAIKKYDEMEAAHKIELEAREAEQLI